MSFQLAGLRGQQLIKVFVGCQQNHLNFDGSNGFRKKPPPWPKRASEHPGSSGLFAPATAWWRRLPGGPRARRFLDGLFDVAAAIAVPSSSIKRSGSGPFDADHQAGVGAELADAEGDGAGDGGG